MIDLLQRKVERLLQTKPESGGVILDEFGESFWIELVMQLDDGRHILVTEYHYEEFKGQIQDLEPVELVQDEFLLGQIEGQTIIGTSYIDPDNSSHEFAVALGNGLFFHCSGAPGGNFPWIWEND